MVLDEATSNSKEKAATSLPISFSSVRETSEGARCSERGEEKKKQTEQEEDEEEKERKRGEGKSYYGEQSRACRCNQIN